MYLINQSDDDKKLKKSDAKENSRVNHVFDSGFWTKPIIGVGKASQLVPINNLTKLYCEFRIKSKKYDLDQGVLFGKPK